MLASFAAIAIMLAAITDLQNLLLGARRWMPPNIVASPNVTSSLAISCGVTRSIRLEQKMKLGRRLGTSGCLAPAFEL